LNEEFGAEVDILVDIEIEKLAKVDEEVAKSIKKFREDEIIMVPGGGGDYGERIIPEDQKERNKIIKEKEEEIKCTYKEN